MNPKVQQAISAAESILEEEDLLSKRIIEGLKSLIATLKNSEDISLDKHKCLNQIELLSNNENIDSYLRTQLWDVTALLERL